VERAGRAHAQSSRSPSTMQPCNSSVAIVQKQTKQPQNLDCNEEIGSEDDDFEETISVYSVPKGKDQSVAFLKGSTRPPKDKHRTEGQEDHIVEQDDDFEKNDECVDLAKNDIQKGHFICAQERLLHLGLQPEHTEKKLRNLVLNNSIGYENLAIEAVVFRSDSHPSTITIFVDAAIQKKCWEDLQHFFEKVTTSRL
jgi:hypothetical protein